MNSRWCVLLLSIILCMQSACAVQKQDELECVLSNGDKFVLIATFDYTAPIFSLGCWHCKSRVNETQFKAYFEPKGQKQWPEVASNQIDYRLSELKTEEGRQRICSVFALISGTYSADGRVLVPGEKRFRSVPRPYSDASKNFVTQMQNQKMLAISAIYLALIDNKLISELFLVRPGDTSAKNDHYSRPLLGAGRSVSIDNGKTWSDDIIATDSKLFIIGKSLLEQPGVAKPGRYKVGPGAD